MLRTSSSALFNAAEDAHIGKVFMMEEGLAAAFGAGVLPTDKRASAIVDIGAGTTNIAIVAKALLFIRHPTGSAAMKLTKTLQRISAVIADCRSALKPLNC